MHDEGVLILERSFNPVDFAVVIRTEVMWVAFWFKTSDVRCLGTPGLILSDEI